MDKPKKQTAKKAAPKQEKKKPAAEKSAKPAPKKSASGKTTPGKNASGKAAPRKSAPQKAESSKPAAKKSSQPKKASVQSVPAQEPKPIFRRRTIAERTVAWKTGKTAHVLRWLAMVPLSLLIVFFTFFMAGYSFTVLVCFCLIGVLLFYNLCDLLKGRFPKETRVVRRLFTTLLCIGLLVVGITECLIIHASFGDPKESVEYIVVLGAKVRPDGPSVSLMDRIYAARDYLTEHPDVIAVVSGGKGADEPMSEAQCMYEQLVSLGIAPERIWMEDKATSTWENLRFTLDLIEGRTGSRPTKMGILSSEYHLFRAGLFADASGIDCVGIPASTSRLSQKINHFMREVAGVWHYLLLEGQYHD